ncbi:MAG: flagellar basal body L-ring protein FlgH [Bdellovibrionales bacterium]|nr:flagellar basal body L-ring protein FlgH [Bdellovibrionales bacterium]
MNLDLDSELNSGFFNGTRSVWVAIGAAALLFALGGLSGCSQLMGGLRPDLNDEYRYEQEPTYGGRFTEGGLLDEGPSRNPNSEDSMGHREGQASAGRMGGQGTWLTQADDERPVARRSNDDEGGPALAPRPVMQKKYKYGNRASRADFIDDSRGDGSLWNSDGQTNYLMTKNTVKSDGDLVTIVTDEEILKDISAELKRVMSPEERENEIDIAQERARRRANGLPEDPNAPADAKGDQVASAQSAASRSPASFDGDKKQVDVPAVSWGDVDLRKSMEMKAGDPIMAEVMERYPNGNYKLRGLKRVRLHGQTKMVSVVAIARHADITADETIPAGKLYEYRIEAVR